MNRVPDALANATLQDDKGSPVEVKALYKDRPVVLVFLRHFG